ncbi:MAG: asparagine--tRNA ligase [Candidatus Aenigmarchaeota archaeon]|nr:asparagine--tRNA ligase [Candidatus Aenigmarchaeota archaeon]
MITMDIKKVPKSVGKTLEIKGWVYRKRESKNIIFFIIRDSDDIVQCTIKDDNKHFEEAKKITMESSVIVKGTVNKDERSPTGYEMKIEEIEPVHIAERYPITKDQSTELLLDYRHLWLRSRYLTAVMKIRHTVVGAIHKFFRDNGYYEFDAPVFQPSQCEGGSTLFEVKYFDDITYLTQSWQLYAEAAVFALEKVYNMGPTFRAERSKTSRHLSEFWMAEAEAAWMDIEGLAQLAKDEVRFIVKEVLKHNRKELELLGRDISKLEVVAEKPFPTITYTEALNILEKKEGMKVKWGKDLRTVEEDRLMKHFDVPIVVTNYPKEIMAFYKPKDPKDEKTALCMDMLAPEGYGEIIGGSQRDTDIKELEKALKKMGEDPKNYEWYMDLRKYGSVPHSGYGMGVERVVSWICGLESIRDAIPFPRTQRRFKP